MRALCLKSAIVHLYFSNSYFMGVCVCVCIFVNFNGLKGVFMWHKHDFILFMLTATDYVNVAVDASCCWLQCINIISNNTYIHIYLHTTIYLEKYVLQ